MRGSPLRPTDLPPPHWWAGILRCLKTGEVLIFKVLELLGIYRTQRSIVGIPSLSTRNFTLLHAVVYNGTQEEVLGFRPRRLLHRLVKGLPDVEMFEAIRFDVTVSETDRRSVVGSTETRGFVQLQLPWQLPWKSPNQAFLRMEPQGVKTTVGKIRLGNYEILSPPVFFLHKDIRCMIISDIDDTIKDSDIAKTTSLRAVISSVFRGHYYTYLPLPGMAEIYRKLVDQNAMITYLTSTPYQLAPFLLKFLRDTNFPLGPVFPRWLGYGKVRHKWRTIHKILSTTENRKCILIGDSGEKDLEVYRRMCDNPAYGDRVTAILIRHVPGTPIPQKLQEREHIYRNAEELEALLEELGALEKSNDSNA